MEKCEVGEDAETVYGDGVGMGMESEHKNVPGGTDVLGK